MNCFLAPLRLADAERMRPILGDAALAWQFDILLPQGQLEHKLGDPLVAPEATFLALADGAPAGFCIAFVLPQADGAPRAALRIGVATRFRRRGLGTLLLERAAAALAARTAGRPATLDVAAWQPSPEGDAFTARHGFRHVRWFWRMSRAPLPAPPVTWPAGVETRLYDGSDALLRDWNDAYNASFAKHWGFIPGTVEHAREIVADPLFLKDGVIVAYRNGRVAGFCRNEAVGRTGVVGVLGTVPEARGIGLGRALLRWAIGRLGESGFERVSLLVDGENETALRLYRSEGFEVERTRRIWSRPLEAAFSAGR